MSPVDVPIPFGVSAETRKYLGSVLPLERWSAATGEIDALRQHERDGCAPYSEKACDVRASGRARYRM
jgi:hypothetical protein